MCLNESKEPLYYKLARKIHPIKINWISEFVKTDTKKFSLLSQRFKDEFLLTEINLVKTLPVHLRICVKMAIMFWCIAYHKYRYLMIYQQNQITKILWNHYDRVVQQSLVQNHPPTAQNYRLLN
jgi:hypothetical protein